MDFGHLSILLEYPEYSDVIIQNNLEDGSKFVFDGHSCILKCQSPVFKAMLGSDNFLEGETSTINLNIQGGKATAIHFIRYLYTGDIGELGIHHLTKLLKTAHMYQVEKLCELCCKLIEAEITPRNICEIFCSISHVASKDLLATCWSWMNKCGFLVFQDSHFVLLTDEQMTELVKSDCLNVLDEDTLLKDLWQWGYTKCVMSNIAPNTTNIKSTLLAALPHVRWNLANGKSFPLFEELKVEFHQTPANPREPKALPEILGFVKFQDLIGTNYILGPKEWTLRKELDMLTFCVTKSIILFGFEFFMYVQRKEAEKLFIKPNMTAKINDSSAQIADASFRAVEFFIENNAEYYYGRFKLELVTPVLLARGSVHIINFEIEDDRLVSYLTYKQRSRIHSVQCDNELEFHIIGDIHSVTTLYYFNY